MLSSASVMYLELCLTWNVFRDNSMVSFLIAFGFMCLQDSGVSTRSVVGTLCGLILILTFWCILTSWKNWGNERSSDKSDRTTLTFEEDHAKRKEKGFKFKREGSVTESQVDSQPTERPRPRSTTLSLTTALELPFKKLRRDSSKKEVEEEDIDDKISDKSSSKSNV